MKVINDENKILDSNVIYQSYDYASGIVFESRGGTKGSNFERNVDYFSAIETIIERLKTKVAFIEIYLVSKPYLSKSLHKKRIVIDERSEIPLSEYISRELRIKISKAVAEKKENKESKGGNPTKRILISANLKEREWEKLVLNNSDHGGEKDSFNPYDIKDALEKKLVSINVRQGQEKFRKELIKAYEGKCAITKSTVIPILQAAHIFPYKGKETHHVTNGILLRADIHDLFDLYLLGIDENYKVIVSESLKNTEYEKYNGISIILPKNNSKKPNKEALKLRPIPYRK